MGIALPHSITPPSGNPSTLVASALPPPPHPLQTLLGARVVKPGKEDFGLGRATSLFSSSPRPAPNVSCAERGAGTGSALGPPPLSPKRVPGPCLQRHLLPQAPSAAQAPGLGGECGSAGERARGRCACILPPSSPFTPQGGPARGREPWVRFPPWWSPLEKRLAGPGFGIPRGTGRGAHSSRSRVGTAHSGALGVEGNNATWRVTPARTNFQGGGGRRRRGAR